MLHIFDNVCNLPIIENYKNKIFNHYNSMKLHNDPLEWYPTRNITLNLNDPLIFFIKKYIETKIKVTTNCYQAELQTWPVGEHSGLHRHEEFGREQGDFNSVLYLNEDFEGGEFFTENGVTIKPKTNRLTFFNGKEIFHGVKKVVGSDRFTVIFWLKNTKFF